MQLLLLAYFLGVVSTVVAAAFIPVDQRQATSYLASLATDCVPAATTTVTSFVTVPPSTITIADTSGLAASISSAVWIESAHLSNKSELNPVSTEPYVETTQLTITEVVPVVQPTLTSYSASSTASNIAYVSIGENTTTFLSSYTAPSSVTIGVTTITLSPVPSSAVPSGEQVNPTATVQSTTYTTITTQVTSTTTIRSGFPLSTGGIFTGPVLSSGWNATSTPNTLLSALSGSGVGSYAVTLTTTVNMTTTTVEASNTGSPSISTLQSTTCSDDMGSGYGNGSGYVRPSGYGVQPVKRQTCTNTCSLVYAAFGTPAVLASWCNNYFGSTTINLPAESYCATETPSPVPTLSGNELVTPTTASSTPPSSTSPPPPLPPKSTPVPNTPVPIPASPPSTAQTPVPPPPASTSQPAPASTSCGVSGPFVITFDNLPNYGPADNNTAEFPPIPDPYDLLWWSAGWAYVPPPTEPFPPQSGTHLAEFIPSRANNASQGSTDAGDVPNGAVGAGPQNYDSAYWFDVESAWIGIDNGANDKSVTGDFVATAYKYDVPSGQDQVVHTQHFSPQSPCPQFENCHLNQIFFDPEFTGLSAVSFYAIVQGEQRIFFIDTIQMSWWNNTCAAGRERVSQRKG